MNKLSDKQLRATELLASGKLGREVAQQLGVTPETISHWKKLAAFEAQYNSVRREVQRSTVNSLQAASGLAVNTLVDLMKGARSDETKRRAAVNVLELLGLDNQKKHDLEGGSSDADEIESQRNERRLRQLLGEY